VPWIEAQYRSLPLCGQHCDTRKGICEKMKMKREEGEDERGKMRGGRYERRKI
jgi:hypothetical protein